MVRVPVLAFATVLAGSLPAFAGEPPRPEDVKAVQTCLGTDKLTADRRRCIGIVADRCLEQEGGDTTAGMTACYDRENLAWDSLLNRFYGGLQKSFDEPGRRYLKEVQAGWIRFRDDSCQWPEHVFEGGSLAGPLAVECLRDATAERTLTLMQMDESQNPR